MNHPFLLKLWLVLCVAMGGWLLDIASARAYEVVRLTDNAIEERGLDARYGRAVWQARSSPNGTYEIVYWPGYGDPVTLSDNDVQDLNPRISQGGVVWYAPTGVNDTEEIWVYPGPQDAADVVTSNAWHDRLPRTGGGWLTWQGQSGAVGTWEIYLQRNGAVEQVTANDYDDETPVTDGSLVAWVGHPSEQGSQIYLLAGSEIRSLSSPDWESRNPVIHDGWVAWEATSGGNSTSEVFLWNGDSVEQVTSNSVFDGAPSLWRPRFGWEADHIQVGFPPEIRVRDMDSEVSFETANTLSDFNPVVGPETVAWLAYVGPNLFQFPTSEVQIWDGSTTVRVTDNGYNERGLTGDEYILGWLGEAGPSYSSEVFISVLKPFYTPQPIVLTAYADRLEWTSAAGRVYAVERKASWGESWSEVARVAADGATAEWGVSTEVIGQAAFFRVVDVTD